MTDFLESAIVGKTIIAAARVEPDRISLLMDNGDVVVFHIREGRLCIIDSPLEGAREHELPRGASHDG